MWNFLEHVLYRTHMLIHVWFMEMFYYDFLEMLLRDINRMLCLCQIYTCFGLEIILKCDLAKQDHVDNLISYSKYINCNINLVRCFTLFALHNISFIVTMTNP